MLITTESRERAVAECMRAHLALDYSVRSRFRHWTDTVWCPVSHDHLSLIWKTRIGKGKTVRRLEAKPDFNVLDGGIQRPGR